MSKQLFEEALADVKEVKRVAEEQALRTLTEAVTPRIREFIDRAILSEVEDDVAMAPGSPPVEGELLTDTDPSAPVGAGEEVVGVESGITPPDAEGKVTLDLDAMCGGSAPAPGMPSNAPGPEVPPPMFGEPAPRPEEAEYEISLESIDALKPVLRSGRNGAKPVDPKKFASMLGEVVKNVNLYRKASSAIRATPAYGKHIALMISRVEDMYEYVQESVGDPAKKGSYETTLEDTYKVLNKLQESTTMSKKTQNKGRVNEADLTLKLTGLPDDVEDNLDGVGVDLITGEDEESLDVGDGAEGGEGADLGDLDLGGDQGQEDEDTQMESTQLSDDTIVEIDEKMLRREIARMRSLREETKPAAWGDGPGGANILDDFGGGKDEGDPATDQEIADLSPAKAARPLGEADEDLDEAQAQMDEQDDDLDEGYDQMDEQDEDLDEQDQDLDQGVHGPKDMSMQEGYDDLDQVGDRRTRDDFGGSETSVPTMDKDNPVVRAHAEAVKRLGFEKKLQERAKARAAVLRKEAAKARGKRLAEVKKEYRTIAARYNESVARSKKLTQQAASAAKKLQEARSNSVAARPADKADKKLREKLAETNLINAKLLYANKLLQLEGLTARQKAQVVKQLDEAATPREAQLIYQSLTKTLAAPAKSLSEGTEGRKVLGSASRATRPASTQSLNEGADVERWATLAGITRR